MSSVVNKVKDKVSGHSSTPGQHAAAVLREKGTPIVIENRPTPKPGPNEILIEAHAVALNPIDVYQRAMGFALKHFPTVIGSDVAGIVADAGSDVPSMLKRGTRVAAFAPTFYTQGLPNYGATQKYVLVPADNATPIPEALSFKEASLLPMSIQTAWTGFNGIGIGPNTKYNASEKKGLLVWGGASSVGSGALQVAKILGFTVYATASEKHHEYLKSLGATRVFDYKDPNVIQKVIKAAKEDGVAIDVAFDAAGQIKSCGEILKETKSGDKALLAEAVPIPKDAPTIEGVQTVFVTAPDDEKERQTFFRFVWNQWVNENLANGKLVPSPKAKVVRGGLEAINEALDELKAGVSGVKLVLQV
jgi:NADPH:quinone reductase-like Zn-dependent oxidoreductase